MDAPIMLTVKQAAARTGIPLHFVRRLVAEGAVHSVKSGTRIYISRASLERYLLGMDAAEAGR